LCRVGRVSEASPDKWAVPCVQTSNVGMVKRIPTYEELIYSLQTW
jgi:hypothetical protein